MYQTFKKIENRIIPESVLRRNEKFLRGIIALKYKGQNFQCNICDYRLKHFVKQGHNDLLCPNCGSLSRTRRLYYTLLNLPIKGKVLHLSPPKALLTKLREIEAIDYYSSDFDGQFESDYKFDITSISQPSQSFDVILCYHILEHIQEDIRAMEELFRVLKANGRVYIQTPFKEGKIYENNLLKSREQRRLAFGQEDHVRIYSLKGLNMRLQSVGFKTKIIECIKNTKEDYYGLLSESYIVAEK